MTPAEIAVASLYQIRSITVPNGISTLLGARIERIFLYVETDQAAGNVNISPFQPLAAKSGKAIALDNPGLFTWHDWAGMLQMQWFVNNGNIGNITLKVLEAWIAS